MPRACGVLARLLREGGPLVGVVAVGGRAQRLGAHGAGRACGAVRGQQPRVDARARGKCVRMRGVGRPWSGFGFAFGFGFGLGFAFAFGLG